MTSFLLQVRGGWSAAPNTDEIWQFGVRLWMDQSVPDNSGTFPALDITENDESGDTPNGTFVTNWAYEGALDFDSYLGGLDAAVLTLQASIAAWSTHNLITQLRLYPIDNDGKALQIGTGTAVAVVDYNSPQPGQSSAALLPLEVAQVCSWDTYKNTAKGRGRIYLPGMTTTALGTEGRWSDTHQADVASAAADFLSAIAIEDISPTDLHVRPVVTGPSGFNSYSVIKRVRVGSVPDSQRRRRNRVTEIYVPEDVVYG